MIKRTISTLFTALIALTFSNMVSASMLDNVAQDEHIFPSCHDGQVRGSSGHCEPPM
jgi:hypothetical protein